MPSAKKLRGKHKKKAKKQRLYKETAESVAKEIVASIVECDAELIKVPLELDDDELSTLVDAGLLGALLFRVHYGFDEKCEESFASCEADIQQSLSTWFGLLSTISRRAPGKKTKLIPQYLESIIQQPFYFGSDEKHDPKTWIAQVFCKVVDRLMTCNTFYKSKRLHQSAVDGILRVLATLEEVDEDDEVTRLDILGDEERYPKDAIQLMAGREEFLKFTCKTMISLPEPRSMDMDSSAGKYEPPRDPYFSRGRHLVLSEEDMASDGSDWTDPGSDSSSEGDHTVKSEDYDMEIDGFVEERRFADAACYVRCVLGYRMHCRESHDELGDRMLDLAFLPTREGSIYIRDIIAILRARKYILGAQDVCFDILDQLVIKNCVDEEIIKDLVCLARESNDRVWPMQDFDGLPQGKKADITKALNVLTSAFQGGNTHGSVERRVGVAVKAGLLDAILGFVSIVAEDPWLRVVENSGDTLGAASRLLEKVAEVANKKKARIAIIDCQEGVSRELTSLRQLLRGSKECRDVLKKLQSVLDEGTGPVARTCSVCFKILFSGEIFRCERCCEVYCSHVCQKKAWQEGHNASCTKGRVKQYKTNTKMLELHAKYILGVWIEQGESELVKAMEETLVFPRAGAAVLSGCVRILIEKPDSNMREQARAMVSVLCKKELITKSDIEAVS